MKSRSIDTAIAGRKRGQRYEVLDNNDEDSDVASGYSSQDPEVTLHRSDTTILADIKRRICILGSCIIVVVLLVYWAVVGSYNNVPLLCDSVESGFQCQPEISHHWGQYSPFFSVPSEINPKIPQKCQVTFAQVLSRHGARDPTAWSTIAYKKLIQRIHDKTEDYSKEYQFLKDYEVTLGSDQLTVFGEQQLVNSGIKFFERYRELTMDTTPFIRSAGQARVVQSAKNWTQGFHDACNHDGSCFKDLHPYPILQIPEGNNSNNSLSIHLCKNFNTQIEKDAKATWMDVFLPSITVRVNENLQGANLSFSDTIHLMDLCPYETVASTTGSISYFCTLFTESEWKDYDYYQTLGKYYGYSWGNPLAPPQGIGFTNELIARLTNKPVNDHTSTNSTLDHGDKTFPIGKDVKLYADFSHDNDMQKIFAALGLFNETMPLDTKKRHATEETNGFSAAASVPFASRMYVEKLKCSGEKEEWVRVLLNDRVMPLKTCGADESGRCSLSEFVKSLSYARNSGDWEKCFD